MPRELSLYRVLTHPGRVGEVAALRRTTAQWLPVTLRYLEAGRPSYPYLVRLRTGGALELPDRGSVAVFWHIFVKECYSVDAGDRLILDVGAHTGLFAVWAARRAPGARVVCYEPHPANFDCLRRQIERNGLERRVETHQEALAGRAGSRRLRDGRSSAEHYLRDDDAAGAPARLVSARTLDSVLAELAEIDFMKMDIEGSEYEVLMSTSPDRLRCVRRLQLEFHQDPSRRHTKEDLFRHLRSAGFAIAGVIEDEHGFGVATFEQQPAAGVASAVS